MAIQLSKSRCLESIESESVPELDVTPVMNMFVILIPFLISMAVFTHMSILSFSLPPDSSSGINQNSGKPRLKLTVVVTDDYLAITHGEKMLDSIPTINGFINYSGLVQKMITHRASMDIQDEAIVAVRDSVKFQDMVKVMDICRAAGFEKIGVSSASVKIREGA